MSSSNSPCAACKLQRRKCTQECIYAPYFPPDQPQKFANVHKVFGASNVAKLLYELNAAHREDAVNSLAYEAEARLRDPVYGCVGLISYLQQNLKQIQLDLYAAKRELSAYIGPSGMLHVLQQRSGGGGGDGGGYMPPPPPPQQQQQHMAGLGPSSSSSLNPYDVSAMLQGHPACTSQPSQSQQYQHHKHHVLEAQEMVASEQQEMWGSFEQQRQQEFVRFNVGFDAAAAAAASAVCGSGFNQMAAATAAPSLTLGELDNMSLSSS